MMMIMIVMIMIMIMIIIIMIVVIIFMMIVVIIMIILIIMIIDHDYNEKDNSFMNFVPATSVFFFSLKDSKKSCVKDARGYLLDISIITSCRLSKCLKAAPTSSVSLKKQFKLLRILPLLIIIIIISKDVWDVGKLPHMIIVSWSIAVFL